jgi:ketosteroid isomerase-like protein
MTDQDKQSRSSLERSTETTRQIVNEYFSSMRAGVAPDEISSLFSDTIDWNIPGNTEIVPWIGRRRGRSGVAEFIRDLRDQTLPIHFKVRTIVVEGENAVALGDLEIRIQSTGKIIKSEFAFYFTVREGLIVRFRLFADGHAVSDALIKD